MEKLYKPQSSCLTLFFPLTSPVYEHIGDEDPEIVTLQQPKRSLSAPFIHRPEAAASVRQYVWYRRDFFYTFDDSTAPKSFLSPFQLRSGEVKQCTGGDVSRELLVKTLKTGFVHWTYIHLPAASASARLLESKRRRSLLLLLHKLSLRSRGSRYSRMQ